MLGIIARAGNPNVGDLAAISVADGSGSTYCVGIHFCIGFGEVVSLDFAALVRHEARGMPEQNIVRISRHSFRGAIVGATATSNIINVLLWRACSEEGRGGRL